MNVDEQQTTLTYKFKRSDGVCVTTVLQGGKAHIMEEEGSGLRLLERNEFTPAERALLNEVITTG